MKKFKIYSSLIAVLTVICSISCGKIKKTDAEFERENWIAGFSDSIDYYQDQTSKIESRLQSLNRSIADQLDKFEMIKKPREVEGYYILKGWNSKLPFTSTSVYARISEREKFEIIATLSGATFNQIAVEGNGMEFYSEVVPHDQAFNFRHERFNTVYFSSGKIDTITEYISNNYTHKLNLLFLEGKIKKNFIIPESEKDMIRQTWSLYNTQIEAKKLQKELWISSKKIEAFRRIMDAENKTPK